MAQALYRKYRPIKYDDVVGQAQILKTLKNEIESNNLSHAYLFCGPRGTGKTTMARLVAKSCLCSNPQDHKSPTINPCGKCEDCIQIASGDHPDVYELDAASRTGVDNVREEIIGRVGFAATTGEKKLYIIDEVHMLSTAAFNALLKTLEEPPNHVIFILCTTDPQKIPDTIISRCQRFNFKSISVDDIKNRLNKVVEYENANATESALEAIAKNANGAMRNALTQLEQLLAYTNGNITNDDILSESSEEKKEKIIQLVKLISKRNLASSMDWVEEFCQEGSDFISLSNLLSKLYRNMFVAKARETALPSIGEVFDLYTLDRLHRILNLLSDLLENLKTSVNHRLTFELFLAKITYPDADLTLESLSERISELENNIIEKSGFSQKSTSQENNNIKSAKMDLPFVGQPLPKVNAGLEPVYEERFEPEGIPEDILKKDKKETDSFTESENINPSNNEKDHDQQKTDSIETSNDNENIVDPLESAAIPKVDDHSDFSEAIDKTNFSRDNANKINTFNNVDFSDKEVLQQTWNDAFSKIRNKYPAYGAILFTASAAYDKQNNQLLLKFPSSASFAIDSISKPEAMSKVHMVIKSVFGDDIGLDFRLEEENNKLVDDFDFVSSFRDEEKTQHSNNSKDTADETNEYNGAHINENINKQSQSVYGAHAAQTDNDINNSFSDNSFTNNKNSFENKSFDDSRGAHTTNNNEDNNDFKTHFPSEKHESKVPSNSQIKDMLESIGATDIKVDKE